ncbi:MAG: hypothetical protein MAG581_01022 [Deltaproteobacteria bacterium]|nr:hypothetical protein [Deltaproteobacteria bacterium]
MLVKILYKHRLQINLRLTVFLIKEHSVINIY